MRVIVCCVMCALVSSAQELRGGGTDGDEPGSNTEMTVKQAFSSYALGDVFPSLPSELLYLRYGSYEAMLGNELCPYDIQYPYVNYDGNPRSLYTFICINPDISFYLNQTYDYSFLTSLVVNIRGEEVSSGDVLSGYKLTLPPPGTGQTRNVCVVYRQPRRINVTKELVINIITNLYRFNITDYLRENRLGSPIAGNFFLTRTALCNSGPSGGNCGRQNDNNCDCNCCSC